MKLTLSNPPYVSSKQEELDTKRFRNAEFYKAILFGDINLYLLFLRLGLYYLAEYGQMIYIIPLTLFGDKSASSARKLIKTPPFSPSVLKPPRHTCAGVPLTHPTLPAGS
jgi:hypothetical protein